MTPLKRLVAAGLIAAVTLTAAPPSESPRVSAPVTNAEDWNFHAEASTLLDEIQSSSVRLTREAAILHSYPRMGLARISHANQLTLVKEQVNQIGDRLNRLKAIRHAAAPWHQQAIDSVMPVAANLASNTTAAIQYVNGNNVLWLPEYTAMLENISVHSGQLKDAVDVHLQIEETRGRLEQLRDRAATLGS